MGIELFACSATKTWNMFCILGVIVGDSQLLSFGSLQIFLI